MTLIEHIHAKHLRDGRHDPACVLCVEAAEKRPLWVQKALGRSLPAKVYA